MTSRWRPPSDHVIEFEVLLLRYPHLDGHEVARLVDLFHRLSMIDQAIIASDPRLAPRADAFFADHRAALALPWSWRALAVAALAVVGAALFVVLAD